MNNQSTNYKQDQKKQGYAVHQIIDRSIQGRSIYYKVWWQGYPQSESTWQPRSNLRCVNNLLKQYDQKVSLLEDKTSIRDINNENKQFVKKVKQLLQNPKIRKRGRPRLKLYTKNRIIKNCRKNKLTNVQLIDNLKQSYYQISSHEVNQIQKQHTNQCRKDIQQSRQKFAKKKKKYQQNNQSYNQQKSSEKNNDRNNKQPIVKYFEQYFRIELKQVNIPQIVKVQKVSKDTDSKVYFHVKSLDGSMKKIPHQQMKILYPDQLIQFYQQRITWS